MRRFPCSVAMQDDVEESELVGLLGEDTVTAIRDLSHSATKEGEVKVTVSWSLPL